MDYHVSFPGLGLDFTINRVAFSIGGFSIYWYALLIVTGLVLALIYAKFNAKRFDINVDKLLNCFIVGLITAIVGARLYYVIFSWDKYSDDFWGKVFDLRDGGLAIYGGIIGGLLGGLIVAKIQKMKLLACTDLTLICFLIGQSVGRWGNFMNQEAFGTPTDSIFGMVSERTGGVAVHPCFLYESLWCALGFVLLHIFSKKWQKYFGQLTLLYMIWYGFERMFVEGLRTDSLPIELFGYSFRVSQLLSGLLVVAGIVLLIIFRKRDDNLRVKKTVAVAEGAVIDGAVTDSVVAEDAVTDDAVADSVDNNEGNSQEEENV